jgi:hypothetical protein
MGLPLIPTPWETRNLGRPAFVVDPEFLDCPDLKALDAALSGLERDGKAFISVRVDKARLGIMSQLGLRGFSLVEATLDPFARIADLPGIRTLQSNRRAYVPNIYDNMTVSFATLGAGDNAKLDEVRTVACESFAEDRFHCDPNCATEIADRRFGFWVDDLTKDADVVFDVVIVDGVVVGLMARKGSHLILAGFSPRRNGAGLGAYLWLNSCQCVQQLGHGSVHSRISVNNMAVLNLYVRLGFKFRAPQYTYHLWLPRLQEH